MWSERIANFKARLHLLMSGNFGIYFVPVKEDVKMHKCWLQPLTATYRFSYISWLPLDAEYEANILF